MPPQHAFRSDLPVLYARSSLTPATGRRNWDGGGVVARGQRGVIGRSEATEPGTTSDIVLGSCNIPPGSRTTPQPATKFLVGAERRNQEREAIPGPTEKDPKGLPSKTRPGASAVCCPAGKNLYLFIISYAV